MTSSQELCLNSMIEYYGYNLMIATTIQRKQFAFNYFKYKYNFQNIIIHTHDIIKKYFQDDESININNVSDDFPSFNIYFVDNTDWSQVIGILIRIPPISNKPIHEFILLAIDNKEMIEPDLGYPYIKKFINTAKMINEIKRVKHALYMFMF